MYTKSVEGNWYICNRFPPFFIHYHCHVASSDWLMNCEHRAYFASHAALVAIVLRNYCATWRLLIGRWAAGSTSDNY